MINLRYALTPADFASFSAYVQIDAPGKKKVIFKKYLPLIVILLGVFGINIASGVMEGKFDTGILAGIAIFITFLSFSIFSVKPRLKKQALQFAANTENAALFNMADYVFAETGVQVKDAIKDVKYQWSAFVKKEESAEAIYLFLLSSSAIIIPKRVFRSVVEKEKFDQLLSTHLSFNAELGHLVKNN